MRVIKDMRGDGDGLARTPVKVLMVAGHAAFLFPLCVREIERDRGREGQSSKVCVRQQRVCVCVVLFFVFLTAV